MKKTMENYISEAPSVAINNVDISADLTEDLVKEYIKKDYRTIWIVASGSSYNSSLSARNFMRRTLKCEVKIVPPATFVDYEHDLSDDDFVFVVSQTGYSTNAIKALEKIRSLGIKAIGVTGNKESDFKEYSDLVIDYGVGVETVGYVTKGVTTLVTFLVLFSLEGALKKGLLDEQYVQNKKLEIVEIMNNHEETIDKVNKFIDNNLNDLASMSKVYAVGSGASFGTAYETTLKIGETVHVPAFPYELEEYIHGPNLQLDPTYTVFILDNCDHTHKKTMDIYKATQEVTNNTYLITGEEVEGDKVINVFCPKDELLTPLAYLPVVQTIAFRISDYLKRQEYPGLVRFKKVAKSKSDNYVDND